MKKLLALGIAILTMTTSVFAGTDVNVKVNDKEIEAKGVIVDGRTLVPVRGIFEELGYFVVYNAETRGAAHVGRNGRAAAGTFSAKRAETCGGV